MLRLAFVTGTEPGKWFKRYRDSTPHGLQELPSDDPFSTLIDDRADLALVRLPDPRVGEPGETYHRVLLYAEKPGVAVPKDSVYAEVGEPVRLTDLADEHVNYRYSLSDSAGGSDIDELRSALQVVAANVGVAYAPAPLLKVLAKKQVKVLDLIDDPAEEATQIALVWPVEKDNEVIQDFVGVARGRTRNSSRGETSKSDAKRAKANRKVNGKSGAQRKQKRASHPKTGARKRRR